MQALVIAEASDEKHNNEVFVVECGCQIWKVLQGTWGTEPMLMDYLRKRGKILVTSTNPTPDLKRGMLWIF